MKSLSILLIDQYREIAGGQVVLQALVKSAREQGCRVGVLAPLGGGLEAKLAALNDPQLTLHDLKQLDLQDGRKSLRDLIRLVGYCFYVLRFWRLAASHQMIYVNGCRVAPAFLLLSLLIPWRRWFYHVHLCHSRVEKLVFGIISLAPGTQRVVMASDYIKDDFFRTAPWLNHRRRFVVLENGLDSVFDRLDFRDRFQGSAQALTVALIGRVSPEKGQAVLPRLARRFPQVRFLIIGRVLPDHRGFLDGLLEEQLPNLIYLGETSQLAKLLEAERVQFSIVPSRWEEPFGLTSIESMAASCLTLVSNKGMLPLIAARTGALCFESDEQLELQLEALFATDVFRLRHLAQHQYTRVRAHFGATAFRNRFIELIQPPKLNLSFSKS